MTWTRMYANDATGNATAGDLAGLVTAIENGIPIRFAIHETYGTTVADAQWVYVRQGVVYGENTANVSDGFRNDRLIFQEDAFNWYVTVSTAGDRDMSRWKTGEHVPGGPGHTHDQVALDWFADL